MKAQDYKELLRKVEELNIELNAALAANSPEQAAEFEKTLNYTPTLPTTLEDIKILLKQMEKGEVEFKQYGWRDRTKLIPATYEGATDWANEEIDYYFDGFTLVHIETHGGGEGSGEEYWMVFAVQVGGNNIAYFKWSGYYASYDGGYLTDLYEVIPVEKTITVFDKV